MDESRNCSDAPDAEKSRGLPGSPLQPLEEYIIRDVVYNPGRLIRDLIRDVAKYDKLRQTFTRPG